MIEKNEVNEPSFWRIILRYDTGDVAVWPICKEKGLIAIDFPDRENSKYVIRFKDEVKIGDKVISYLEKRRIGGIGTITGEYQDLLETKPKELDYFNGKFWRRINVDWDLLPKEKEFWEVEGSLSATIPSHRMTLRKLPKQEYKNILLQIDKKDKTKRDVKTSLNGFKKEPDSFVLESKALRPGEIIDFETFKKIHKNTQVGIYIKDGIAKSIRFDTSEHGAYPDKWIERDKILDYTGQGKAEDGDQVWNMFNLGLKIASEDGFPIKVFEPIPKSNPKEYKYYGNWYVTDFRDVYIENEKRKQIRFTLSQSSVHDPLSGAKDVSVRPIMDPNDSASDSDEPPARIKALTRRIIRDTKKTKELKILYENRCQICSNRLYLSEKSFYSEVHHIIPLGGDHKGLDSKNNMLVLCPNHHAMFDYKVITVRPDSLTVNHLNPSAEENGQKLHLKHRIDTENLEYHDKNLFGGESS
ncbi:HNH endonuclease [Acidobacteriota bacterium]